MKTPKTTKTTFLKPTFYGLPDSAHTLTVQDFFPNGKFISIETLNAHTGGNLMQMQYNNLKFHIKCKIGVNKTYDAIPKLNLPQKKHTHATISSLMVSIKKDQPHTEKSLHGQTKILTYTILPNGKLSFVIILSQEFMSSNQC